MKCVQLTSQYPELINVKLFSDGVTPFHRVCSNGNIPLIELMVAKGKNFYPRIYIQQPRTVFNY